MVRDLIQALDRRDDRLRAGADEQLVKLDLLAALQFNPLTCRIDGGNIFFLDQRDSDFGIVRLLADEEVSESHLTGDIVRQSDARISRSFLAVDNGNLAIFIALAN